MSSGHRTAAIRPAGRIAGAALAAVLAVVAPAAASTLGEAVAWALYDSGCADDVVSALQVPCGALGVLHFDATDDDACHAIASGRETPRKYPRPRGSELDRPAPARPPGGIHRDAAWVAVVDWDDWHGHSVGALVEIMAAGSAASEVYPLDHPVLGDDIGDQHVLAALCRVAEDAARRPERLVAVNMSFGRLPVADDPTSADCDPWRLACQVARVLAYLRERGVAPVAAAGNHHEVLFPALLAETLAVAPIDLLHYGLGVMPRNLWESPAGIDAIVPGQALCIAGQVAPAGSSYATAFFTGWYALLAAEEPAIDAFAGDWVPGYSRSAGCFVLSQAGVPFRICNPNLERVLAGLILGGEKSGCWRESGGDGELLVRLRPGPAERPPNIPSFDQWAAGAHHPAPESDPCIPCVGNRLSRGPLSQKLASGETGCDREDGVVIALSDSAGISPGVWLDRVYFRNGESYYPLRAPAGQIELLATGDIGGLLIEGLETLPPIRTQPSLVYVLKTDRAANCDGPRAKASCYWTSSPVLLR